MIVGLLILIVLLMLGLGPLLVAMGGAAVALVGGIVAFFLIWSIMGDAMFIVFWVAGMIMVLFVVYAYVKEAYAYIKKNWVK